MTRWVGHHLPALAAVLIVGAGVLTALAARRAWPLLLPVPCAVAALAWYGWEFSDEALPYAIAIAVFGYIGLGIGAAVRSAGR